MIPFWKLHGIGNDFVFVRPEDLPHPPEDFVRELCDRHLGLGSDGLITVQITGDSTAVMRMWNPDGSESGMCGNGLRCAACWLRRTTARHQDWSINLGGGTYSVKPVGDSFSVSMGAASIEPSAIGLEETAPWINHVVTFGEHSLPGTAVSTGNPHLVFFVEGALSPWLRHGPILERHPSFRNRTNVHFARVVGHGEIEMVTWERGAGVTQACGSGACAVAEAANLTGRINGDVLVHLPGGDLTIRKDAYGLTMIGPAEIVFKGEWPQ